MRKLLLPFVFFIIMTMILFGCNFQIGGKFTKVSVSDSIGFGDVNPDFFVAFEDEATLNTFAQVISKASKQKGIVNIAKPDYDFEVIYSNGDKKGFHLWLGEKGYKSTLMHAVDTHTIYTVPEELTDELIELLNKDHQTAKYEKPYILKMLGLQIDDEQYAGLYIEDGIYHINIVGEVDDFIDKAIVDNVMFHSVNYSLKHLYEVAEVLSDNMLDLGITAIVPSQKDNKVYVYIKGLDDTKRKRIKKVIDSPVIEAKEQHLELKFNLGLYDRVVYL